MSYSSISLGGMNAAMTALDSSAWRMAQQATRRPAEGAVAQAPPEAPATVRNPAAQPSLEADVIGQLQAKNAFLMNLRSFQAGDEMLGSLLDTKA